MRSLFLSLVATTALCAPVMADPLRDMASQIFGPLPDAPAEMDGNPVTPEKVALGQSLFFDARLSSSWEVSCVSCHDLAAGGADATSTSLGHVGQPAPRNVSTVVNAMLNESQFWDGRDEDIALQTDGIVKAGLAAMNAPEAVVATLQSMPGYVDSFAAAFPGEADAVTYDNAARAIEAFQATLLAPAPFDAWLKGDDAALSDQAKAGLQLFNDYGCSFCHYGPNLGGMGYYPFGLVEKPADELVEGEDAFTVSEGTGEDFVFRAAPLRNIALTAPYFHAGQVADLATAVEVMAESQLGSQLEPEQTAQIVAFLESLSGTLPEMAEAVLPPETDATPRP